MALVTHQAIVSNIDMGPAVLPLGPEDSTVAFLPSAHIAQRVVIELLPDPLRHAGHIFREPAEAAAGYSQGAAHHSAGAAAHVGAHLFHHLHGTAQAPGGGAQGVLRRARAGAGRRALPARGESASRCASGCRCDWPTGCCSSKVRARFGGRLSVAASGAAPLSKDLAEFYEAVGMPLIEGYGLTEGGVVTLNPLDGPKPGSIGKPLAGVEVRVSDDGELLIQSPCLFSGYLNDPATTAEVLRDGWLHTGDIGHRDADGYFFITGRKKELIVSSTGKKIYPSRVENLFKMEPLISQVLLIGDRLPFLTALFTINNVAAEALKGMEEWRGRPASEVVQAPPVLAEIHKAVARVNRQLAPFEQVRKYRVLARDFSIEQGELTATMKVRRTRAMENFKDHIDELYAGRE